MNLWNRDPLWTLEQGREVIATIQSEVRQFGFHIALGGGVLNVGQSFKDLDVYFLPLDNDTPVSADRLVGFLTAKWDVLELLSDPSYGPSNSYKGGKFKSAIGGKRVDIFIVV